MWVTIVFSVILIGLVHWVLFGTFGYWKKRNVPFPKPKPFIGNIGESLLFKKHLGIIYQEMYNNFKDYSWIGFYKFKSPSVLIRDVDLIKDIIIKDFAHFHDNDFDVDEKIDPLFGKNPFVLNGHKWKVVRGQITGAFTSGKIKNMFIFINNVSKDLVDYLNKEIKMNNKDGIDTKDLCIRFTTDVVAACAFGLDGKSFTEPNPLFKTMGEKLFRPEGFNVFKTFLLFVFPDIIKYISISVVSKDVEKWFIGTLKETIKYREENKIVRNDYLDLMLSLKQKTGEYVFTDIDVMAQSMTFYGDGMETSATALSCTLYELARHPEIQENLRKEVDKVLNKYNGDISYDAIHEMSYLDMVISESLRMYPPVPFLMKRCTTQFTLPSPQGEEKRPRVVINPGMSITIPVFGIHYDPEYYPEPNKFIPERFTEDEKKNRPKCAYLPFGEGPRQCLGIRFALVQLKVALATIVSNFELDLNSKTLEAFELDPKDFLLSKIGGIYINFKKRT